MGEDVGTRAMNRELSTHLSELRIEGASISAVDFSEPCSVCGNKKRRCLQPPTSYRKKVLVVEDDSSGESVEDFDSFTTSTPSPSDPSANRYCRCGSRTWWTTTPSPATSVSLSPSPERKRYETPIEGSFLARLNALGSPVSSGTGKRRSSGGGGGGGESGSVAAEKKRVDSGCSPAVDGNGKKMHDNNILGEKQSSGKKKALECSSAAKSADKVKVTVSCKCGTLHEIVF